MLVAMTFPKKVIREKKYLKKNFKLFYGPKSNLASNLMKKIKVNYLLFPKKNWIFYSNVDEVNSNNICKNYRPIMFVSKVMIEYFP